MSDGAVAAVDAKWRCAVAVPDPSGLLEGTGAKMRHVKVRSEDDADADALRVLLEAARAERARALGR